jgi:polar amino acid transport system substrate-binding protein
MDPLTEIYNRQKFDEELMKYLASVEEDHVATIMFDIDDFKKVNDTFGHMEGDAVLKQVSEIARSQVRDRDVLARWGGEEFIILMPHAGKLEAYSAAERIRLAIEKHFISEGKGVTCSFGVTEIARKDDFEAIMKRVDSYLYEAKAKGKNHTMVY